MRIRRLKLSGFKSFVEPSELRIEPGLTGVVGPNGCGKSNLLEAIRWVMGESSAKSMRGGGMEDVIFAGTANRPPRAFAEVVLSAETAAGADGSREDLEVVRRIERGAGSAYRINGRDARAKDVALVFADAATGAHSPALVSQGRIAAVIAARPAERRLMLEEAAGIAGLHVRRKDAEQKLRATETNLARLEDIMAGLDKQIGALRRQARAAERYKALSDQIKLAEARLVFARWRDAATAADAARAEAQAAEGRVGAAQSAAKAAQDGQAAAAKALAEARDELADRRDDASAHGHRMATLTSQLEAAEERLADLDRQRDRLERDSREADRLTRDAADALARLERDLAEGQARLAADEAERPGLAVALERAGQAARAAELDLAQATAAQAGVEAEWRIAEAERAQARSRLDRLAQEAARHQAQFAGLAEAHDLDAAVAAAIARRDGAVAALAEARAALEARQASKAGLQAARDAAASALAGARADLTGIEREHSALLRDREARAKGAKGAQGLPIAIDRVRAAPGYERALAAVLGRDARAVLGSPEAERDGRFWTGAAAPAPVARTLAAFVTQCPPELAARLALVHVADDDDGCALAPGEWLVTRSGLLRRWDGFVARGEGAAEAARLEAENRFAELDGELPARRARLAECEAEQARVQRELALVQAAAVAAERAIAAASEEERLSLRAVDQAEDARARMAARRAELEAAASDLAGQRLAAEADLAAAEARRAALPDPAAGRAALDAARARHDAARQALQTSTAALSARDQALAVARERTAAQASDIRNWQARAGDAASRLAEMGRRAEEIASERAVFAAKPAALLAQIEAGDAVRDRLGAELAQAEAALVQASEAARAADAALAAAQEELASAREARAGAAARAENEEARRAEMARLAGERFQCPPPLLPERIGFASAEVAAAQEESATMDRLVTDRERLGPVNLVAADELAAAEAQHGESLTEQAELTEAVHRLRGSIGNLNREGRERLRHAFEAVDTHFRRLFTRLFQGGQAHLALVDSDDPLEAGLEIYAQPPGKRLQSLTLLSGGEQALTAVALIFALFLTNPAPICVLDEVDAPLDDANIERFCDLLDAMVAETDTRYLIVTHNAVTMSRMHRLFGVTMVEKGVSRLVSVDLGGAEELLAAE
ncbi:chromosome segregation protein SMC [Novosphingobium album (ex Liu et al. 2023)]|uniref:Chromosome partition protein Smc n=1 Tax=Novosphingobium album (ex Liu et al. 2023) TaxID=3031130 RepID=A0ABT5WK02_9SPHN|nr:chromosome segregation protein SMC [Novosphingobium album (ex Liu et al. 2023)]MDE8650356.1 chromosome segregation protein SMC [Novosphingobium album (ex Liu et al. 2023)]